MRSFLKFGLFVALLAAVALCSASPVFTVSTVVHDANGGRIPHARISVHPAGRQTSAASGVADDLGQISLTVPLPGSYEVVIEADGFTPQTLQVALSETQPTVALRGFAYRGC